MCTKPACLPEVQKPMCSLWLSHSGALRTQWVGSRALQNRLIIIIYYLYYTILYYTILCYTILYYTILYYTILYYTILYYTILYYTILYYTILYHTILYYIPHRKVPVIWLVKRAGIVNRSWARVMFLVSKSYRRTRECLRAVITRQSQAAITVRVNNY